jgi:hypothetical protein
LRVHCQSFRRAHARNVITESNFGESNCAEVDGLEHRPLFDLREDETWQENEENHPAREIDHLHRVNLDDLALQDFVQSCHDFYQLERMKIIRGAFLIPFCRSKMKLTEPELRKEELRKRREKRRSLALQKFQGPNVHNRSWSQLSP